MESQFRIDSRPERNYKDTLFRMIFGREDEKSARWRMELYNALSGKNHTNPADLELTTIENAIYITTKNDVSFLVDSQMTLYEHQSKTNKNMPLRGLMYFAQLYQMHLTREEKDLFGGLVKIPVPQYVVFYNGDANLPETSELKLSDAFDYPEIDTEEKGQSYQKELKTKYEWTATVININPEYNKGLHEKCNALYDYIKYVDRVKVNQKKGMSIKDAVDEAVSWAIKQNWLEGFFTKQKAEVTAVSLTEFDQELYDKNRRREGFEEGFESGAHEKAIEAAKNFLKEGDSPEKVARCVGLPLEEVQKLILN